MDKLLAKQIAMANDLSITKFLAFSKSEVEREPQKAIKEVSQGLRYPLFIKPTHLGSSIGISRVQNETELRNGLEVALHYDDRIIVEEAVSNLIEVTLPVMGNDRPVPALLEKPLTKPEDFFDFETKYMGQGKGGKKTGGKRGSQGYSEVPAKLPGDLYERAEKLGLGVYAALGCSGIARVDMLIDSQSGVVYFNEVNPLPGSLYAHNWRAAGYSNVELVEKLIGYAKDRFKERQSLATTFSTNFLQQF
jgi:D-alanine-D-alanine ligase